MIINVLLSHTRTLSQSKYAYFVVLFFLFQWRFVLLYWLTIIRNTRSHGAETCFIYLKSMGRWDLILRIWNKECVGRAYRNKIQWLYIFWFKNLDHLKNLYTENSHFAYRVLYVFMHAETSIPTTTNRTQKSSITWKNSLLLHLCRSPLSPPVPTPVGHWCALRRCNFAFAECHRNGTIP